MKIREGDRFKHKLTAQLYEVKIIKDGPFILESEDTPYRMWFGEGDLELFFEMAGKEKEAKKVSPYSVFKLPAYSAGFPVK